MPPTPRDRHAPAHRGRARGGARRHLEQPTEHPRRGWLLGLLPTLLLVLAGCQPPAEDATAEGSTDAQQDGAASNDGDPGSARGLPHPPVPEYTIDPEFAERQQLLQGWRDDLDTDAARLGQLVMLRIYGGEIDEEDPRNEALYGVATPREVVETFRPGGILLFRTDSGEDTGNLRDPAQVRGFTDDLRAVSEELGPPAIVAIDQEGGPVDRIGHFGTPYATARDLAGDPDAAAEHAEVTATELSALGIDMNFAPVADVDTESTNPIIGERAYSEDPETVAEMVVANLEHYRDQGVVPVIKHFPGHGDTTQDSHLTLPTVDADRDLLERRELVPFVEAIAAGAQAIMTAHLHLPEVSGDGPASMSQVVITELLREDLGFRGLIVTDSLEMEGARQGRADDEVALDALLAGHDLLVLPPVPQESMATLEQALSDDEVDRERVDPSVDRNLRLKARMLENAGDRPAPDVVGATEDAQNG